MSAAVENLNTAAASPGIGRGGESGRSLPRSERYAARWQRQTGRQREADLIWGQCGATAVLCYDNSPSEADVKAGKFDSLAEQALDDHAAGRSREL
jgi:hypothetical protein